MKQYIAIKSNEVDIINNMERKYTLYGWEKKKYIIQWWVEC